MRLSIILASILLTSCGDNITPPMTWGDAQMVWAEAWCTYAERCFPMEFSNTYGTQEACVPDVYTENCFYHKNCEDVYPHMVETLEQCAADMAVVACKEHNAPDSCYQAFNN